MPRGPFNQQARFKTGPGATPADTVIGDYDCRVVTQNGILTTTSQHPSRPYWLTIEDYQPQSGFSGPPLTWASNLADRVALDLTNYLYMVWYTDVINWGTQAQYYRAALIPVSSLDPPPPTDPGATCDEALPVTLPFTGSYTVGASENQWFRWPITSGQTYHCRGSNTDWMNLGGTLYQGSDCSSKVGAGGINSITPCTSFVASADGFGYLMMSGGFFGGNSYDIEIDDGGC